MDIATIVELVKAGYTKQEIEAMTVSEPSPAATPETTADVAPAPAQDLDKDKGKGLGLGLGLQSSQTPPENSFERLEQSIVKLVQTIQQSNLLKDSVATPQTESLEDILSKL